MQALLWGGGFVAGITIALIWGFKSRIADHQTEEGKKSRKHKTLTETTEVEEEQKVANHTRRLRVDDVEEYALDLHKGDLIKGRITADGVFSAYFLTEASRRSYHNGYEFRGDGIEDAYDYVLDFEAQRGRYYMIIANEDKKNIEIVVNLSIVHLD